MDPNVDYWNVPAATPPNGTISNFVDPPNIGYRQTTTNIVVLVIMVIVVLLRLYTRIFIVKSFGYDDCTYESTPLRVLKYATRVAMEIHNSPQQRGVATQRRFIAVSGFPPVTPLYRRLLCILILHKPLPTMI
jgi:hypothetical protein